MDGTSGRRLQAVYGGGRACEKTPLCNSFFQKATKIDLRAGVKSQGGPTALLRGWGSCWWRRGRLVFRGMPVRS
jgi:hypothetical protein